MVCTKQAVKLLWFHSCNWPKGRTVVSLLGVFMMGLYHGGPLVALYFQIVKGPDYMFESIIKIIQFEAVEFLCKQIV